MKIGKKELSYLFIVLGLIMVVGSIVYGNNLASKTETLTGENKSLQEEVNYLQDLSDHKQEYLDESDRMNAEMDEIKAQFPAKVLPENTIMYANGLESRFEVLLDSIGMQDAQIVGIEGASAPQPAPAAEGGEENAAAANNAIASAATSISLYRSTSVFNYESSYRGLKDMVRYVNEDQDRKSVESLDVTYDSTTGNLTGVITMSMYALDGTGKPYEAPVVTGVTDGRDQIISSAPTFNRDGMTIEAGDAATADGKTGTGTADSTED